MVDQAIWGPTDQQMAVTVFSSRARNAFDFNVQTQDAAVLKAKIDSDVTYTGGGTNFAAWDFLKILSNLLMFF